VKTNFAAAGVLSRWFVFLLLLGISSSNSPTLLAAQYVAVDDVKHDLPDKVIHPGQSVHIDVDLAVVNVTVTDPYDRVVRGLEPDNFRVFENNVEQEIQYFSSEDVPISIGVIFDLSGSMANKIGKAKEATLQFFKTANPQDEFFLVGFEVPAEVSESPDSARTRRNVLARDCRDNGHAGRYRDVELIACQKSPSSSSDSSYERRYDVRSTANRSCEHTGRGSLLTCIRKN
jgi:hypothetical protein